MANDVNQKHRRIYVTERIKQIRLEAKDLQAKVKAAPEAVRSDEGATRRHREWVFNRFRLQALRDELTALKTEAKTAKPNAK